MTETYEHANCLAVRSPYRTADNVVPTESSFQGMLSNEVAIELSQQGRTILRFDTTLNPSEERSSVKGFDPFDASAAEGLVLDGLAPIIARDRAAKPGNLCVLAPGRR